MGLGVGGVDSVIPVFSSELASDKARGKGLAQGFQMNIFGLNMAFDINLGVTVALGNTNQWVWRIPIIVMQAYPQLLLAFIKRLPESPRWYIFHEKSEKAKDALVDVYGEEGGEKKYEELVDAHKREAEAHVGYEDMFTPGNPQFHPTIITVIGQVNQALTSYGAVSVYARRSSNS